MKRSAPMRRTPLKRSSPEQIRKWQDGSAKAWRNRKARTPEQTATYRDVRHETQTRAGGRCEAAGMHSPNCRGIGSVVHHIWERNNGGPDETWNTMWCHPDCHLGQIHVKRKRAEALGYLAHEEWSHGHRLRPWEITS